MYPSLCFDIYIYRTRAAQLLDIAKTTAELRGDSDLSYISQETKPTFPSISRAPCLGRICLFETSIALLPDKLNFTASAAEDILQLESENLQRVGVETTAHYLQYPPSFAVDQQIDTVFRSFDCKL